MPVFGVNDRRQPAVSVISTGTKWSGEISLRNGTSCIVAGDFSTQSINRTQTICRQNRHAAPLEMTVEWAACPESDRLRSDCLTSNFYLLSSIFARRPCHFDRSRSAANRKASYWAGWRPTSADLETLCRVSTEWRNPTPKWYKPHDGGRFPDSEYQ